MPCTSAEQPKISLSLPRRMSGQRVLVIGGGITGLALCHSVQKSAPMLITTLAEVNTLSLTLFETLSPVLSLAFSLPFILPSIPSSYPPSSPSINPS
jgi:hypothetical protein